MLNKFLPLFNRLKYKIVYSVSSFFKTDEHQELLKKVNTRLLVWEQQLFNLDSGDSTAMDDMSAEALAAAAHRLLKKNKQISLLCGRFSKSDNLPMYCSTVSD